MPSPRMMSAIASEMSSSSRDASRGSAFDHRDLGAEPAVHLGELQPDVAAANHDEMAGKGIELDDRRAGEIRHACEARKIWN